MAIMDTGAQANFLTESTVVDKLDLPVTVNTDSTIVVFGNGNEVQCSSSAPITPSIPAFVLKDKDLIEDLISPNAIVDLGYRIILEGEGGWIERDGEIAMTLKREQLKWLINLSEMKCLNARIVKRDDHTFTQNTRDIVLLLHRRMGHPSTKTMKSAIKSGAWIGCGVTAKDVEDVMSTRPCPICIMGKSNSVKIHASVTDPRTIPIAGLVSGDIIGPITPTAKDGSRYFFLFVDRRTSYYHVSTSKTKDGFLTSLQYVYDWYTSKGYTIQKFRSDSENIMVEGGVAEFLKTKGVDQQFSLPYAHYQNLVERHVQTVVNRVTTTLHDQIFLGFTWWDYCLFHVIQLMNSTPNSKTDGRTPIHMVTKIKAINLSRELLSPFGQPFAARVPKRTWRFDIKSELGIYVGVSPGSVGGGLVYYPSTRAIAARADLIPLNVTPQEFVKYENTRMDDKTPKYNDILFDIPEALQEIKDESSTDRGIHIPIPGENNNMEPNIIKEPTPEMESLKPPTSRRQVKNLLRKLGVDTRSMTKLSALVVGHKHKNKRKHDELSVALNSEERPMWIEALKTELDSLLHTTKSIIPETPQPGIEYDLIYATTALKKKLFADGTVDKYKVRIPVCGNQLKAKFDYDNPTYSPTVSMLTHTSLLQLSIYDQMHMATYDTVAAYLHQEYPTNLKPLYLKFPRPLALACGIDPNQLFRIKKYLYGLPDAGRAYYIAYSKALEENGYKKSLSDPCLFTRFVEEENIRTYVWIHVDDTFVSSTHREELKRFGDSIGSVFPITANMDVTSHLGISLEKNEDGSITLTQKKLLQQLFDEYPLLARRSKYPATLRRGIKIDMDDTMNTDDINKDSTEEDLQNMFNYMRLLGQLMYITHSRPDILPSVSYAATKSKTNTHKDFQDLLQIVAYLRQTSDYGLTIYPRRKDDDDSLNLIAYVDAAYMSHADASSHTGYCISLGPIQPQSFIINKSQKQKCIATSSTHAEIRALYELTINIIYLTTLFKEIRRPIELPIVIFEDNQSTIDLVMDPTTRITKSKHYLMLIHTIREQVELGLIEVKKVAGDANIANVLTKIISDTEFFDSITKIMGIKKQVSRNE